MGRLAPFLLIFLVYFAAFLHKASQPALGDEIDFLKPIRDHWIPHGPNAQGLWHTPFYPWLLSFIGKLTELTPFTARTIGFFTTAFAATLTLASFRSTFKNDWVLWAFLLLSPVLFGSAILLDYDTTLLVASTAVFLYFLNRFATHPISLPKAALVLGLAQALCLLSKETTPLAYSVGTFVLFFQRKPQRQPLRHALLWSTVSFAIAISVFVAITWSWCLAYDIPFRKVFAMAELGLKVHGGSSLIETRGLRTVVWVMIFPVFWIGLPALALLGMHWRFPKKLYPLLAVLGVTLFTYTFLIRQMTYHFPKYMAPMLPWVIALAVSSVDWERLFSRYKATVVVFIGVGFLIPSPLEVLYSRDAAGLLKTVLFFLIPLAIALPFSKIPKQALTALLLISFQVSYLVHAVAAPERSVHYWFGERSLPDSKALIENYSKPVFSPEKDLGYENALYKPLPDLIAIVREACKDGREIAVLTRRREITSLERNSGWDEFKTCLSHEVTTPDLILKWSVPL